MGYFVGLDLGQSQDYTALAVIQTVVEPPIEVISPYTRMVTYQPSKEPPKLHVRHLERFPLGTRYPSIVSAIAQRLPALEEDGARPSLVVDKTGVGAPVVDLFEDAGLRPIAITITGGTTPSQDGRNWHVPKRDLISTLQVAFQNHRLKVNPDLPASSALTNELLNYKLKITTAGNATYEAWRESIHDDLILSVALAVWYAERPRVSITPRRPSTVTRFF